MTKPLQIILFDFFPSTAALSELAQSLVQALQKEGLEVEIYCATQGPSNFKGCKVYRAWIPSIKIGNRFLNRVFQFSLFLVQAAIHILCTRSKVFLISTDPPFLDTVVGGISKLCRRDYAIWLQEVFPEFAHGAHLLPHPLYKILHSAHHQALGGAKLIVSASSDFLSHLPPSSTSFTHTIPNWCNPKEFGTLSPQAWRKRKAEKYGSHTFVLKYAGSAGYACDLELLEQVLEKLSFWKNFVVLLQIDGIKFSFAEQMAKKFSQVSTLPRVKREALSESLGECDAHLVLMPYFLEATIAPSKLQTIFVSARPVIAALPPSSEGYHLINSIQAGFAVSSGDPISFAHAIEKLAKMNEQERDRMGERGRNYVQTKWNEDLATPQLVQKLKSFLEHI